MTDIWKVSLSIITVNVFFITSYVDTRDLEPFTIEGLMINTKIIHLH